MANIAEFRSLGDCLRDISRGTSCDIITKNITLAAGVAQDVYNVATDNLGKPIVAVVIQNTGTAPVKVCANDVCQTNKYGSVLACGSSAADGQGSVKIYDRAQPQRVSALADSNSSVCVEIITLTTYRT